MSSQLIDKNLFLKKTSVMTLFVFCLSLVSPMLQVFAFEANYYDGPGGYMQESRVKRDVSRSIDYHSRIRNQSLSRGNKLVGMALGGAVGGGLVLALGLAASPILAAVTVVGSVLAGGFIGSEFGNPTRNAVDRATSSSNFMSWAGGLAGGALGFMIPGGSVLGAAVGAGLGGMAGNALADNKDRIASLPNRLIRGGMARMNGGFMGPMGAMVDGPIMHSRLMNGVAPIAMPEGFYGPDGRFVMNRQPSMNVFSEDGRIMDWRTHYSWHDDNGELAYPGWENDLYSLDNDAMVYRSLPRWTTGTGGGSDVSGYTQSYSSGSDISNPDWGRSSSSRVGRSLDHRTYDDGDVYSSYATSDGETFNPDFEYGSNESLVNLSARYQDAVDELRQLTIQNAPAVQRRQAHQEVQRLERLLQDALR